MVWRNVKTSLPDSDVTVLVFCPAEDDPVALGYHDGEHWWAQWDDSRVVVDHWMDLPNTPRRR